MSDSSERAWPLDTVCQVARWIRTCANSIFPRQVSTDRITGEYDKAGYLPWAVLAAGTMVWCIAQGYLILMPLYTRATLPEPDDTIPYVLRTARLADCFSLECPALADLREQLFASSPNHEIATYRAWAASLFGAQHPVFSIILICVKWIGFDFITAYKIVCTAAVALFGLGFACLMAALYGIPSAGFAMAFLALKVFPDTGLNFVVPSNLTMGLGLFVLAFVIYRRGRAPWVLGLGTLMMAGIHPIGLLYALITAAVAFSLMGFRVRRKAWIVAFTTVFAVLFLCMLIPSTVYELPKYLDLVSLKGMLAQGIGSVAAIASTTNNLRDGLFGSIPLFCAAVAWGYLTLDTDRRSAVKKTLFVYLVFLVVALFYPPREPGDTFLRIWIPWIAMLFGLAGHGAWCAVDSLRLYSRGGGAESESISNRLQSGWPVLAVALLLGWWIQMALAGGEQVLITAAHYRIRQPLRVCHSQPRLLLSTARPGDRVLYLSMLIMPHYLLDGCMRLGAVYYHEVMKDTEVAKLWLSRPDLHFAVAYNPLVYHPSFEGLHERRWGISAPRFRFSEWNEPRVYGPVLQEDTVPLGDYKWIDVEPTVGAAPHRLIVLLDNPGEECMLRVSAIGETGEPIPGLEISAEVPGNQTEHIRREYEGTPEIEERMFGKHHSFRRMELDIQRFGGATRRLRLAFSGWKPSVNLAGLSFDDSSRHWPWDNKAVLKLMHKKWELGEMKFSFDPALMLPPPLNQKQIKVLDDCGGSVLFQIDR